MHKKLSLIMMEKSGRGVDWCLGSGGRGSLDEEVGGMKL